MMDSDLAYVLLTEQQLHDREEELGRILTEEYADKRPIFLGILRGVVVFYADMVRRIPSPVILTSCLSRPMRAASPPGE